MNEKWKRFAAISFFLGLSVELLILIIDESDYTNPIEGQLFRISFLLFLAAVLFTDYSLKEWLWIAAFGVIGLISYFVTERNEILRFIIFLAACRSIPLRRMLAYTFWVTLAGCLSLVLLSVTGIYGTVSLTAEFGRGIEETRYCLGIGHPNALHCMFMVLVVLGLYLYEARTKWYSYLLLLLANLGVFLLTDSKTAMIITTFAILGAAFLHFVKPAREWKSLYVAGILILIASFILAVLFAYYVVDLPVFAKMDAFLNHRIFSLRDTLNDEGTLATWSLFSRPENVYYFDLGFVRLFYWYGIIPGILYGLIQCKLLWECYKKKDFMGLLLIVVFTGYTIIEAHAVSVYLARNYILFLIGAYWSDMLRAGSDRRERVWSCYRLLQKH